MLQLFRVGQEEGRAGQSTLSGGEVKELVDEPILPSHIPTVRPPDLTFSQDIDCFTAVNGPSCRLESAESLLGGHAPLDGSVILFQDIVQVLHGPMPTSMAKWKRDKDRFVYEIWIAKAKTLVAQRAPPTVH